MVSFYVLALLCINGEVLLVRRHNATFGNGLYSLVGGKVEHNETARHAIKREVQEETGLTISESAFELVHTFHHKGTDTPLVALCFKANISGVPMPQNNEPEKHDDMQFFKLDDLPNNIIPAHKQAIACVLQNISYSEHGWEHIAQ